MFTPDAEDAIRKFLGELTGTPAGEVSPERVAGFFRAVNWCVDEYRTNVKSRHAAALPADNAEEEVMPSITAGLVEAVNPPPDESPPPPVEPPPVEPPPVEPPPVENDPRNA